MTDVMAEFRRGPMDGMTTPIPEVAVVWMFSQPGMDLGAIMMASEADIPRTDDHIPIREYAYRRTDETTKDGARIFEYMGERARK